LQHHRGGTVVAVSETGQMAALTIAVLVMAGTADYVMRFGSVEFTKLERSYCVLSFCHFPSTSWFIF